MTRYFSDLIQVTVKVIYSPAVALPLTQLEGMSILSIKRDYRLYLDELSPWQCLVLCLVSSQESANKNKFSLIFNTKSTSKIN